LRCKAERFVCLVISMRTRVSQGRMLFYYYLLLICIQQEGDLRAGVCIFMALAFAYSSRGQCQQSNFTATCYALNFSCAFAYAAVKIHKSRPARPDAREMGGGKIHCSSKVNLAPRNKSSK